MSPDKPTIKRKRGKARPKKGNRSSLDTKQHGKQKSMKLVIP